MASADALLSTSVLVTSAALIFTPLDVARVTWTLRVGAFSVSEEAVSPIQEPPEIRLNPDAVEVSVVDSRPPVRRTFIDVAEGRLEVCIVDLGDNVNFDILVESVRDLVEAGEIVYVEHPPERYFGGSEVTHQPREIAEVWAFESLIETIGSCAGISLAAGDKFFPTLLGARSIMRFTLSYFDEEDVILKSSLPLRKDFIEFRNLWGIPKLDAEPYEILRAQSIGLSLADWHALNILHGDAHKGNFIFAEPFKPAYSIDYLTTMRLLYRHPTPAECASDMVGLMSEFSPAEWRAFRLGYLERRPDAGAIFDLIEHGS